jgi:cell division protein FtsW
VDILGSVLEHEAGAASRRGGSGREHRGGRHMSGSQQSAGRRWRLAWLESPLSAYYLILGSTVALATLGLVMVLSSSSVDSLIATGSSYTFFDKQAMFAVVAVPLSWVASRVSKRWWKRAAWPMFVVGVGALLVVFSPLGFAVQGNRNWIALGGLTVQPSEAAKLMLVVWGASVMEDKRALSGRVSHLLIPLVPGVVIILALVLAGHDLGTSMVVMIVAGTLLFVAGAPMRIFGVAAGVAAGVLGALIAASPNRTVRLQAWLHGGGCTDYTGACWQSIHGKWALATGGWWGVGLGSSREKWSWLPEAHNDFIFAVIGEELGLIGTVAVLVLFGLLAFGLFRLVLASDDFFVTVVTGAVLTWVLGQAMINIGGVLGVFPVIGVPLPLLSSGGSALLATLIALGMVLGFARRVPGAPEALAARSRIVRDSLAVACRHQVGKTVARRSLDPSRVRRLHASSRALLRRGPR